MTNSQKTMREAYITDKNWDFIKHVEAGEIPIKIDEKDPEKILKLIWWAWEQKLIPFIEQLYDIDQIND